ncbi:hypothetical protein PISMIDRAFT_201983 [Pisolithus microcarpus 441]|uniref:Uncharacterized protein n=1 Tax=Pisolithus microcarpus 441 TaxID=765257 RepID=A0A0C9ZYB6_9AGAM|nr:hypothetical protein PISMIDRAFT_201983 [Pisolithus microcarpus 441]
MKETRPSSPEERTGRMPISAKVTSTKRKRWPGLTTLLSLPLLAQARGQPRNLRIRPHCHPPCLHRGCPGYNLSSDLFRRHRRPLLNTATLAHSQTSFPSVSPSPCSHRS